MVCSGGEEISRQFVEELESTAVNEVVEYGTAVASTRAGVASVSKNTDGSGILTLTDGTTLNFSGVKSMTATAYTCLLYTSQCVAYHADGAEAHGRPREHGGQQRAAEGEQQARRDGDTDGVVAEGPEEILLDVPQGLSLIHISVPASLEVKPDRK